MNDREPPCPPSPATRVGLISVYHESNSSVRELTPLRAFEDVRGDAFSSLDGTQTVSGGFIAGSAACGLQAIPVLRRWATPSGVVERAAFDDTIDAIDAALHAVPPLDALLLELHGAMVVAGIGSADGLLAQGIRRTMPDVPIVVVLDPHANVPPLLVASVDALLAYQTNPHVDMYEAGVKATSIVARILRGDLRPVMRHRRIPIVAAPIAQATDCKPLQALMAAARTAEAQGRCVTASVFLGYCYADVEDVGMAVVTVEDELADIESAGVVDELAALTWLSRHDYARTLTSPERAVEVARDAPGLSVLADTGDNVGGGAPGDSTAVIRAALGQPDLKTAATVWAPHVVEAAERAGVGARIDASMGTPRLNVNVEVRWVGDGRYINVGPLSAGVAFDMGRVAVLATGNLEIVAQTHAVMANDEGIFTCAGIDLDALDAVILKGAAAVRAGWAHHAARFIDVDSPGATPSDVTSLELGAGRPLWPLDQFEWEPSDS